jgi:hypothetical protein
MRPLLSTAKDDALFSFQFQFVVVAPVLANRVLRLFKLAPDLSSRRLFALLLAIAVKVTCSGTTIAGDEMHEDSQRITANAASAASTDIIQDNGTGR